MKRWLLLFNMSNYYSHSVALHEDDIFLPVLPRFLCKYSLPPWGKPGTSGVSGMACNIGIHSICTIHTKAMAESAKQQCGQRALQTQQRGEGVRRFQPTMSGLLHHCPRRMTCFISQCAICRLCCTVQGSSQDCGADGASYQSKFQGLDEILS